MFTVMWLNLTQLYILGVKEEHIYFFILLFLLGLLYFVLNPFVHWLISLQSPKLLSYMMSSFLFLILIFTAAITNERLGLSLHLVLKISLQCFSVLGIFLLGHSIFTRFIKKQQ
mgnify:CR=1 FL=1